MLKKASAIHIVASLLIAPWVFAGAESDPVSPDTADPEVQVDPDANDEAMTGLPAELSIPLESIPPPVQRTILQRIDDHERTERMLTDQPREIRREFQVIEREDHLIIRMR